MGSQDTKESLVGRNSDGVVRGGSRGVQSSPKDDDAIAKRAEQAKRAEMDNPGRATLPGFRATITAPMAPLAGRGKSPGSIHVKLDLVHRTALRRLRDGLMDSEAVLEDGREVRDWTKTMRWLLEQLAAAEPAIK
jgi:hypothetical protein